MKITFFDTETTGVPHSYKLPPEKYPRIVSLAFVQTNEGKVFKTMPNYDLKALELCIKHKQSKDVLFWNVL